MLWVPLGQTRLEDDAWITERPFLRDIVAMVTLFYLFYLFVD